jgi:probable inactive protein kinase-like protein SgK071
MQEDLSLSIGDFGVSTIMADVRTKTRSAVGSMNWMAPEVLDRPYDERSDVWSAGCIMLELASCSFCDTQTMTGRLFEIKHSVEALEEMLTKVSEVKPMLNHLN